MVSSSMESSLICSSVRKRPDWASLVPALLQANTNTARWKESSLETHDVAMPMPLPSPGCAPHPRGTSTSHPVFRAIFLSPSEIGSLGTRERIERLFNLNGGQYLAIVFLMKQHGQELASAMLMRLQLELMDGWEMPVIPVSSLETVPTTLLTFHHQLGASAAASLRRPDPARCLLPYLSDSQKLPEHAINILTDITVGVNDLAEKAMTLDGQLELTAYLGKDAEGIIAFWKEEYMVD